MARLISCCCLALAALATTVESAQLNNGLASVSDVSIRSVPLAGDTYGLGETIALEIRFDRPVQHTGPLLLPLQIGVESKNAAFGSCTSKPSTQSGRADGFGSTTKLSLRTVMLTASAWPRIHCSLAAERFWTWPGTQSPQTWAAMPLPTTHAIRWTEASPTAPPLVRARRRQRPLEPVAPLQGRPDQNDDNQQRAQHHSGKGIENQALPTGGPQQELLHLLRLAGGHGAS